MLIARPPGFFARGFVIETATGEEVARLDLAMLKEGGRLHVDGKTHRIEREHLMRGPWQFKDGGTVVFEAHKPSMIRNRFLVMVKGASLELAPASWLLRRFVLVGPDWAPLGEIRRSSWFSRRVEIDLSDLVPREAQLFLFFLAVVIWRRAEGSGTSS